MLQQPSRRTPPPPKGCAPVCGDDAASEASSDAPDDAELPQCKIRRNYNCIKCTFFTQNPRHYLVHVRDAHDERIKIYECPHCVYASRHHQKLLRHVRMIHAAGVTRRSEPPPSATPPSPAAAEADDDDPEISRDAEAEAEVDRSPAPPPAADAACSPPPSGCAQCDFITDDRAELLKHERAAHARPDFFSCGKCNYVTHIKARFTKHVKYHSMPMIKCTLCDFRTPYKWNLDRHMKNHGGGGAFCCSMCSFTADIKQSLTVHEMNHHTPPRGPRGGSASVGGAGRRRNKVGASDLLAASSAAVAAADDAGEAMLVKDEGTTDSQSDAESEHCNTSDMASVNNESNDTAGGEASQDETGANSSDAHRSFQNVCSALESLRQSRKLPRPVPQLIPLNSSTPTRNSSRSSSAEPPLKRFKDMFSGNVDLDILNYSSTDIFKADRLPDKRPLSQSSSPTPPAAVSGPPRKKNETFFDKLKERLLTETGASGTLTCKSCGFESKCLSEHSVHEKNCSAHARSVIPNATLSSLSSTRCQNCRHRCKSSADLYVHMQSCRAVAAATAVPAAAAAPQDEPHPMENVVFVWNTISSAADGPLEVSVAETEVEEGEAPGAYDPDNVDALHDTEVSSLSPTQAAGKRVFKCPHCPFWASTASRFHVHIVGHLNRKPFECSLCNYKSNWRWDITKHIRLKSVRDPAHNDAEVLMTDETGRRNYSKYSKYLATLAAGQPAKVADRAAQMQDAAVNVDELDILPASASNHAVDPAPALTIQPLNLQTSNRSNDAGEAPVKKAKKTLWKCKKCNYRNSSKEALLEHVRGHSKPEASEPEDSSSTTAQQKKQDPNSKDADSPANAYQCGHCNQLSNWKHVIQRHCRLKHNGVIKVLSVERPKQDLPEITISDINTDFCHKCPFKTNDKKLMLSHLQQHVPSPLSIFKCYFCPYFVQNQTDLMEHLALHGIADPEDYVAKAMGCKSPLPEPVGTTKRHRCIECPYETNSKSQFMYHEQFHRLPESTPYKCQVCNYSVTKRHLLHQHMKVHVCSPRKDFASELGLSPADLAIRRLPAVTITPVVVKSEDNSDEIPYVWVSAKNEFHKMYKCRYCSYVNSQQCKIPNHEKIHLFRYSNDMIVFKCLECKYTCDSAARLTEHSKFHVEIYGRIYYPVNPELTDEEQIKKLRLLLEEEKKNLLESFNEKEEQGDNDSEMEKASDTSKNLYFCKKCPGRFLAESECSMHRRFHELKFPISCKICTYTIPQESQMAAHTFVHTDDYQAKTKMLQMMHETHASYPQPKVVSIKYPTSDELVWVVLDENIAECNMNDLSQPSTSSVTKKCETATKPPNKHYACEHCPATFFKSSALNYHTSLHGAEGGHKCKKCDYTVKNIGNLAKHELVHQKNDFNLNEYKADLDSGDDMDLKNVPLSGTDLFQHKTEAQKRVNKEKLIMRPNDHFPPVLQADPQFGYLMHGNPEFIYPTYLKNGRQKEKRYKCHKCPSAFEKREQYKVHLSLHGSKQRYKCELCDYSVKYYANYVQHMRKHQMNAEAHAERSKSTEGELPKPQPMDTAEENDVGNIKLAIKSIPKYTAKSDFMQFSIGDQQTLRLLQRRRSSASSCKDPGPAEPTIEKDKKVHACVYCPYSNQRRDALENHERRHKGVSGNVGHHECPHCDFTCNQTHFLRDHLKSHFNAHKNAMPQCYVQNQDVVLTITKLVDNEDGEISEISFSQAEDEKDACSKVADKIFIQPATGEIAV